MARIFTGVIIALSLITVSLQAHAQNKTETRHIVMVLPKAEGAIETAFKDYLEKRRIPVKYTVLLFSGKKEDGPATVNKVRSLKPDLIYTWGTPTSLAIAGPFDTKQPELFIRDTPIIFTEVTTPTGSKLLQQLSPPGRNVTGVSHVAAVPVTLNTIRAYRPFKTLGYITNPAESNTVLIREALEKAGESQGFKVLNEDVPLDAGGAPDPTKLPEVIRHLAERKPDFLYIGPSTFLAFTHRNTVTREALAAKLPTFCATESIVRKAQCLFGLFSSESNTGRFAAFKAAEVLVDRKPVATIPAETLARFSLIINIPVAKALKIYPPLALINVADAVGADQPAAEIVPSFLDGGPPPVAPPVTVVTPAIAAVPVKSASADASSAASAKSATEPKAAGAGPVKTP